MSCNGRNRKAFSPEGGQVLEEALERAGNGVGQLCLTKLCSLGVGRVATGSSRCVRPPPTRSSSSRDRSEKAGDRGDRESRSEKGSDRLERPDRGERADRNRSALTKRSFSKEAEDRSREREKQGGPEAVRKAASMTEERDRSRETGELGRSSVLGVWLQPGALPDPRSLLAVKQEPAPPAASPKPALSDEELEKKSKAIIEEYLHINDMKVGAGGVPGTVWAL